MARPALLPMRTVSILLSIDCAQFCLWEPDVGTELLRQTFGFLVEHQEDEFRLSAAPLYEVNDLFVLQQVIVDILDRLELGMRLLRGAEHVRVLTAVAVDIADVFKVLAPTRPGRAD